MALSQREKMLLVVPVVIGSLLGHYNLIHEPLFTRKAAAQDLSEQVAGELAREQSRLAREGDLNLRRMAVNGQEQVLDAWIPGKNSAALFIWYLSQAERQSGARIQSITVSDRQQVSAKPEGAPESAQGADPASTLTLIRLDMKVSAHFLEHLLFNQHVEKMPLFLNTDGLSLTRDGEFSFDEASQLAADGDPWAAAKLLGASPTVAGTYQINLYFKGGKVGPSTDPMTFAQGAGRVDPFAMGDIDEFIRTLLAHYNGEGWQDSGGKAGQLG